MRRHRQRARSRPRAGGAAGRAGRGAHCTRPSRSRSRCGAATRARCSRRRRTMAARFAEHPGAVAETARLADRLRFDLTSQLGYRYPGSEDPEADRTLAEICRGRLDLRYAGMPERPEAERRLEEELRVIRKLELSGFFLLHFDLLELAREIAAEVRGPDSARNLLPPGRGRGSSVSSVVCYLTGLSHVDPVRAGLFLGRFLNDEITEMPDIDLDFPRDIREQLIPRDPRPLRARALGARLRLRHLPLSRRRARPRQGARPAAGRDRARRRDGRRVRARSGDRARHRRGPGRGAGGDAALALARAAGARGLGAAPPPLPASRRDGALHQAARSTSARCSRRRWRGARSSSGTRTHARMQAF